MRTERNAYSNEKIYVCSFDVECYCVDSIQVFISGAFIIAVRSNAIVLKDGDSIKKKILCVSLEMYTIFVFNFGIS